MYTLHSFGTRFECIARKGLQPTRQVLGLQGRGSRQHRPISSASDYTWLLH